MGPPKTEDSRRLVDLPLVALRPLEAHLRAFPPLELAPDPRWVGLVFYGAKGSPVRRYVFRQVWTRACEQAKVDPVRAGWLRHTGASMAYAATHDLKATAARLGHTSTRMVDSTYVQLYEERGREVADGIDTMVETSRKRPVARTWHEGGSEPSA